MKLSEFDVTFHPRPALKSQKLTDFMAEAQFRLLSSSMRWIIDGWYMLTEQLPVKGPTLE
jgi:hypothetical protein